MQLFRIPSPPQDLTCAAEFAALATRDELLAVAKSVQVVTTAEESQLCAFAGSGMQELVKGVESARKELTAPYLAAQRSIKSTADQFCEPITKELDRLGRLAAVYRQEQERKAEAERRARASEISRLQEQARLASEAARLAAEKGDMMGELTADIAAQALAAATTTAIAAPEPEATKTAGQAFQDRVLCWECTDPHALYLARPELCEPIKPKASAIKAVCCPDIPVPGLRLWYESKVNFKSK